MKVRSARRRAGGPAVWLGTALLAVGLSGCNPIDSSIQAYRSLSGINRNDPDPAKSPFNANLAQAETEPYGNLASVPPPPVIATSLADRQKLAANLTGQRTSAQAPDARGQPGSPNPGAVPPPPPVPPSIAAPELAALPAAPPPPTPVPPMRPMDEPPSLQPSESTMQPPQIGNAPPVEPARPAPAEGRPSPLPAPAPSALPPSVTATANPQPAPPPATLPVPKPTPAAAAMPPPRLPPTAMTVASVALVAGSSELPADEHAKLLPVVEQYRRDPRTVRVVAYANPGVGSAEQLNAFRAALDHAQLVADALAGAGIPANRIETEAAPASPALPAGRIDVQLLH